LEDLIIETLIYRLESEDFARIYAESEDDTAGLRAALHDHQVKKAKLDDLIDSYYGENPDGLSRASSCAPRRRLKLSSRKPSAKWRS
jgi:hypothetical protein